MNRREASLRLPPLECGCHDPDTRRHRENRCRYPSPVTDTPDDTPLPPTVSLDGPSFAEIYAKRWDGRGRDHFADPQPDDYPGQGA